jgi:WD40 repeat protein
MSINSPKEKGRTGSESITAEASFRDFLGDLGIDQSRAWHAYVPLAFAEGEGFPLVIWRYLARSISERQHPAADIAWLLRRDHGFVIKREVAGRAVYRMGSPHLDTYIRQQLGRPEKDIQQLICESLLRITRTLRLSQQRDWWAADLYIRSHIIEHAAAVGSIDWLANDLIYLSAADPPRVIGAMYRAAARQPSLQVYRLSYDRLEYGNHQDNLSYLQLSAYQDGEIGLATRIDLLRIQRRWSVLWAQRTFNSPHHVLGRHGERGESNVYKIGNLNWGVHGIDAITLKESDIPILVSSGFDRRIRVWDLEHATEMDSVLKPTSGSSLPMQLALGLHHDTVLLAVLGGAGEIQGWTWVSQFEPFGRIGRVLHLDLVRTMAAHSTPKQMVIAACGVFLQLFQFEDDKWLEAPVERLLAPSAIAMETTREGKLAIAIGSSEGARILLLNGILSWSEKPQKHSIFDTAITAVALDRVDKISIFGTENGSIETRKFATGELLSEVSGAHHGSINSLTVANQCSSRILVSGGGDGMMRIWRLPDLLPLGSEIRGHNAGLTAVKVVRIKNVESIVTASEDATIRVWDLPDCSSSALTCPAPEGAYALAVGALNGKETLISLTGNGNIRLWESSTGLPLRSHSFSLPFSRNSPPANVFAIGSIAGQQRAAVSVTHRQVLIWDPIGGDGNLVSEPGERHSGDGHHMWCVCLGTVEGRLARVAFYDQGSKAFVQVFDMETGQAVSAPIETWSPLNSLRLGELRGEPVISTRIDGLLCVARLADGSVFGEPMLAELDWPLSSFASPVAVGTVGEDDLLFVANRATTLLRIVSVKTGLTIVSVDMATEILSIATASEGVVVGTRLGLSKLKLNLHLG